MGCRRRPGKAGANGGDGVRKFGCGAALSRGGPARSVLENGPLAVRHAAWARRAKARKKAEKAKKAERRSRFAEQEPEGWGPDLGGVATRGEPWAL